MFYALTFKRILQEYIYWHIMIMLISLLWAGYQPLGSHMVNDTYIGAWNAIPPARPVALQAFLGAIMRRTAIDRFRANNRQKRVASEFTISLSELEDFIADDSDMNAEIEAKELGKIISNYVRSLSDRQMYIFVGRYYFAEPIAKICEELGCSSSTAKREIKAIKNGLKEKLESEGFIV